MHAIPSSVNIYIPLPINEFLLNLETAYNYFRYSDSLIYLLWYSKISIASGGMLTRAALEDDLNTINLTSLVIIYFNLALKKIFPIIY